MASEQVKTLMIYVIYGIIIGLLAWLGYITAKYSLKIGNNIGSAIGGIIGIVFCIFLWFKVGERFAKTTSV